MSSPRKGGEITEWFSPEELETARALYLEEQDQETPSPKVKLRYAKALAKSSKREDKERGINLFEDLRDSGYEITECQYWIALTYYGLGNYKQSRLQCESLLRLDPSHAKAKALHECIKESANCRDSNMIGIGIVGVAVALGLAVNLLLKK